MLTPEHTKLLSIGEDGVLIIWNIDLPAAEDDEVVPEKEPDIPRFNEVLVSEEEITVSQSSNATI